MAGEQHWDALCPAAALDAGSNAWLRHGSSGEQYIKLLLVQLAVQLAVLLG